MMYRFSNIILICFCLFTFNFNYQKANTTIFLIGDSTMADKPHEVGKNPERGWGQAMPEYFKSNVKISNYAKNGRSSKSFITEGLWQSVIDSVKQGDYVFIQFGHNDEKSQDSTRYTHPTKEYKINLLKFINETRNKKAIPVLLTSIVRRKFDEKNNLIDTHGQYLESVREIAKESNVLFIDMQKLTAETVVNFGPEKSKELYVWVDAGKYELIPEGRQDDTHLSGKGASLFAGLVANAIRKSGGELSELLK